MTVTLSQYSVKTSSSYTVKQNAFFACALMGQEGNGVGVGGWRAAGVFSLHLSRSKAKGLKLLIQILVTSS